MKNKKQTSKHEDSYVMIPIEKNNLALVASAPIMLEALEAVEDLNYRSDETDHNEVLIPVSVLEKVIQAIAKAKGE